MSVSDVGVTLPLNKNKKNMKSRAVDQSAKPAFKPRGIRETSWHDPQVVGIPDSLRTKLRYGTTGTASTTLGGLYTYQFRGNSAFDPDYTGSGSQPTYHDQLASMYNSYVVLSSELEVEFIALTTQTVPALVGIFPAYNLAVGTTAFDCAATRYAVSKTIYGSGGAIKCSMKQSQSTAQQFGVAERAIIDDDLYSASTSASPAAAQTWYWTIFAQDESGTATLVIQWRAVLVFDVKYFDPIIVNLSAQRHLPTPGSGAAAAQPQLPAPAGEICTGPQCIPSPLTCGKRHCVCAHIRAGEFPPVLLDQRK